MKAQRTHSGGKAEQNKGGHILLFIIGQCSSCFEDELFLWNNLHEEASKKGVSFIAINSPLRNNFMREYQKERMVNFPVLDGKDEVIAFLKGFETHQVLSFVVDPNRTILKAHSSIPKRLEFTEKFCKTVLEFLQNNGSR